MSQRRRDSRTRVATIGGRGRESEAKDAALSAPTPPPPVSGGNHLRRTGWDDVVLALISVTVVVFYAWKCSEGVSELGNTSPDRAYYNLLVDGYSAGQLNLRIVPPLGLVQLPDPWDPAANAPFRKKLFTDDRLHDSSYYRGKIYLYFSSTPALLLFWPYHALTGGYLEHRTAVAVFCAIGFLLAIGLWRAIRRRCFPHLPIPLFAAGALALGMANTVPVMMARPDVWEVPISCGYALTIAALAVLWRSLHDPVRLPRWLALASILLGLAVSCRPSLVLATPSLLLPIVPWWRSGAGRDWSRRWRALAAVVVPLGLIGLAMAWHNEARFGNSFEFGQRYQLADVRQDGPRHFSLDYLGYNFRLYFLSLPTWSATFPFVTNPPIPPMPPGHADVDGPFGILVNTPFALFALALPVILRPWSGSRLASWRWFAAIVAALFVVNAAFLCLFFFSCTRYQVEFHPELVILATIAVAALHDRWSTSRVSRARALSFAAVAAVVFSTAFSVFKGYEKTAENFYAHGTALDARGDYADALTQFERTTHLLPSMVNAWLFAGIEYHRLGQTAAAIERYRQCIRVDPANLDARNNLGLIFVSQGRLKDAAMAYEDALRVNPRSAAQHFNLGVVLQDLGDPVKSAAHLQAAIEFQPDHAPARYRLALSLRALGRIDEARREYAEARRLQPDLPQVQF